MESFSARSRDFWKTYRLRWLLVFWGEGGDSVFRTCRGCFISRLPLPSPGGISHHLQIYPTSMTVITGDGKLLRTKAKELMELFAKLKPSSRDLMPLLREKSVTAFNYL